MTNVYKLLNKYKNVIANFAIFAIGIYLFIASFFIPRTVFSTYGGEILPRILGVLITVLGTMEVIKSIKETRNCEEDSRFNAREILQVVLMLVLMAVYYLTIKILGFIIGTSILLFVASMILSDYDFKRWWIIALVSIAYCVALYFIFAYGLDLVLPRGILG